MTEIYCKCGPQTLEDTTCAECGETLRLRWIPVSERLPEIDGEYWAYFDDDFTGIKISGYVDYHKRGGWENSERVTHWMPLPPPPEDK